MSKMLILNFAAFDSNKPGKEPKSYYKFDMFDIETKQLLNIFTGTAVLRSSEWRSSFRCRVPFRFPEGGRSGLFPSVSITIPRAVFAMLRR